MEKPLTNIYTLGDKGLMIDADTLEEAQVIGGKMGYLPEQVKFLQETVDWAKYYAMLSEQLENKVKAQEGDSK